MKITNDTRRRKQTDDKKTPKPATEEDKARLVQDIIQYQRTNIVIGRANLVITVPAMAIRRLTIASGKRRAIDESSPR